MSWNDALCSASLFNFTLLMPFLPHLLTISRSTLLFLHEKGQPPKFIAAPCSCRNCVSVARLGPCGSFHLKLHSNDATSSSSRGLYGRSCRTYKPDPRWGEFSVLSSTSPFFLFATSLFIRVGGNALARCLLLFAILVNAISS